MYKFKNTRVDFSIKVAPLSSRVRNQLSINHQFQIGIHHFLTTSLKAKYTDSFILSCFPIIYKAWYATSTIQICVPNFNSYFNR